MFKRFVVCSLIIISLQAMADNTINQLYHSQIIKPKANLAQRIDAFSAQFLGKPYLLGALGEGEHGYYDSKPLYRTDAFDCETYVDTVLALAFAHNIETFEHYIRHIRYQDGRVSFIHRNHFTSIDWNLNNQKQGFLKDITSGIHDQDGHSVAKTANALIDKPGWYAHFTIDIIRIQNTSDKEKAKRLDLLKQKGSHLPRKMSKIAYIPLTALFDQSGQENQYLFNQIPNGAVIEIVRPNWDLTQQIGTRLNVSHLGFAIRKNGTLMFRSATSLKDCVMDWPMIEYLRATLKSPTIKGINIQIATYRVGSST